MKRASAALTGERRPPGGRAGGRARGDAPGAASRRVAESAGSAGRAASASAAAGVAGAASARPNAPGAASSVRPVQLRLACTPQTSGEGSLRRAPCQGSTLHGSKAVPAPRPGPLLTARAILKSTRAPTHIFTFVFKHVGLPAT